MFDQNALDSLKSEVRDIFGAKHPFALPTVESVLFSAYNPAKLRILLCSTTTRSAMTDILTYLEQTQRVQVIDIQIVLWWRSNYTHALVRSETPAQQIAPQAAPQVFEQIAVVANQKEKSHSSFTPAQKIAVLLLIGLVGAKAAYDLLPVRHGANARTTDSVVMNNKAQSAPLNTAQAESDRSADACVELLHVARSEAVRSGRATLAPTDQLCVSSTNGSSRDIP